MSFDGPSLLNLIGFIERNCSTTEPPTHTTTLARQRHKQMIPSSINNYDPKVPILQHCAYFGKRQLGKRQANIDDGCSTRRR